MVLGVYGIVVKVKTDKIDNLKEIVTWHLRRLDKFGLTTSMIEKLRKQSSLQAAHEGVAHGFV